MADDGRRARQGKKIRGTWPSGRTTTATWDNYDEWFDDRFGEGFGFPESGIGASASTTLAETARSFWDGCHLVEWVDGPPDGA